MSSDLEIPKGWSKVALGDVATEYSVVSTTPQNLDTIDLLDQATLVNLS